MPNYKEDYKHYKAELAKIEPKYMALLETVKGLEKLLNLEAVKTPQKRDLGFKFKEGAFEGFTLKDTVLTILYKAKPDSLTTREIVDVVEGARFKHGSKNLWNTANTTLDRLRKKFGLVKKTSEGWAITDSGIEDIEGTGAEDVARLFSETNAPSRLL